MPPCRNRSCTTLALSARASLGIQFPGSGVTAATFHRAILQQDKGPFCGRAATGLAARGGSDASPDRAPLATSLCPAGDTRSHEPYQLAGCITAHPAGSGTAQSALSVPSPQSGAGWDMVLGSAPHPSIEGTVVGMGVLAWHQQ